MLLSFYVMTAAALWSPSSAANAEPSGSDLYLEFPAVEYPFTFLGDLSTPSMQQSLWLSTDFYEALHFGLGRLVDPRSPRWWRGLWGRLTIVGADILTVTLPPALAWQHEEWHRAVMTNRDISSFNDVYKFDIFADVIAVSRVKDEDLVRLKRESPADQVRMSTAGIEGNYELAKNIEKVSFFYDTPSWHASILLLSYLENSFYMFACASTLADEETETANEQDGTDVSKRDFAGFDCTAWTYDMFRPDEPYEARGPHPSGVGLNRYRRFSDLDSEEQRYLRRQARLSLLNLVDPNLLDFRRFRATDPFTGRPLEWNAALRHLPSPFGYDIRADVFLKEDHRWLLFSLHNQFNDEKYFPGVEGELIHLPLTVAGRDLSLGARLFVWMQPSSLEYRSRRGRPGALAAARLGYPATSRMEVFAELEGKSSGWVAGNVALGEALIVRLGATFRLDRS